MQVVNLQFMLKAPIMSIISGVHMESMCVMFMQADSYDGNKPRAKGAKHSAAKNVLKMIRT